MDRIANLKSFIAAQPDNPFPRYGLAMEYRNAGRLEEAQEQFDKLTDDFPDYIAAYLMSGNNLADLGRKRDAARTYQLGIQLCVDKGDSHTKSELQAALEQL